MIVRTKEDWWELARQTIPYLPEYAADHMRAWDQEKAEKLLAAGSSEELHAMFERLWADLPDSSSIRRFPFFDLCDLCSEYWPFYESEGE